VKFSTLVLGFLVLVAGAMAFVGYRKVTEDHRAWRRLLALEGQDLRKNAEACGLFSRALRRGRFDVVAEASHGRRPWRIVRVGTWVLLLEVDEMVAVRVHTFGEEGNPVSAADLYSGWGILAVGARAAVVPQVPWPILEVRSLGNEDARDVARQYYAVVDGRPVLLRLEDGRGRPLDNVYDPSNHLIGPRVPDRAPEEWEAALYSGNVAEVLRTLVWLGGRHAGPGTASPAGIYRESRAQADRVQAVRTRPGVCARVAELERSSNFWIRDAAALCVWEK